MVTLKPFRFCPRPSAGPQDIVRAVILNTFRMLLP
jgi:hypothetical protein